MTGQKAFIEHFRKIDFGLDGEGRPTGIPEHVRSTLEQTLGVVSKDLYSDDLHFVYELIQNAQDNTYKDGVIPHLKFILLEDDPTNSDGTEGCLCVVNNEEGFSEADIKSICSAGKSTKKQKKVEGFIGEKGIGFKSVFKVTSFPHIFSNGFKFKFLSEDKLTGLSYIIPYWVDNAPDIVKENEASTCILLPLQRGKYQSIKDSLEVHKPEIVLFLDKLKRVEIDIPSENHKAIFDEKLENDVLTLSSTVANEAPKLQEFFIARKLVLVPNDINEEKRDGVTERTISIALPLQKYDSLNVYAYLPTEMKSGLPFIVNADFLLTASREGINKTKWNRWLLEELAEFASDVIVKLAKSESIGIKVYGFIPYLVDVTKAGPHFLNVAAGILHKLKEKEFIRNDKGSLSRPQIVRSVKTGFRELFENAEHSVEWLSSELTGFELRLSQLGLKRLSKDEKEAYYHQERFVAEQADDWFLRYYQFLLILESRDEDSYPILPLEEGGLERIENQVTYYPVNLEEQDAIKGHFFPPVKRIRKSLFEKLNQKFLNILRLKEFSVSDYFKYVVMPEFESLADTATLDDKFKIINFLLENWNDMERFFPWWKFGGAPVLLDDESLVVSDRHDKPFVVPYGMNGSQGWEAIFTDADEINNLAVLHGFYLDCSKQENLESYYEELDVSEFPQPFIKSVEIRTTLDGIYKDYYSQLNNDFFRNKVEYKSSDYKRVSIPMLPSAFHDVRSLSDDAYETLVNYINVQLERPAYSQPIAKFQWYYRSPQTERITSPYDILLEELSWVKTTQGFQKPSACFVDDINLKQIFGDHLPYLKAPLSDFVIEKFDIAKDATTQTIIGYLCSLTGSIGVPFEAIEAIYFALSTRGDLDTKDFADHPIILIPGKNSSAVQWCTTAQVIWEDITAITDDRTFESLEPHYPDKLKYFFTEKLGVKDTIDTKSYADLWLNLQSKNILSEREWKLYIKAFSKVRSELLSKDRSAWMKDFKKSAKLYSDQKRWVSSDDDPEAFLPDEPRLKKAFSSQVPFIKRLDDYSYERMLPLVRFLDFESFNEVVTENLLTTQVDSLTPENKYFTDFSLKLFIRLLVNKVSEGKELINKLKSQNLLFFLFEFRETEVNLIRVEIAIPYTKLSTTVSDNSVFIDLEQRLLFIRKDADPEDVKDELERLLINKLLLDITTKHERDSFEDSISKVLGVSTSARYTKIVDKKPDWHIPQDILTSIDRVIKDRPVHPVEEQALQEIVENDKSEEGASGSDYQTKGGGKPENEPSVSYSDESEAGSTGCSGKTSENVESGKASHSDDDDFQSESIGNNTGSFSDSTQPIGAATPTTPRPSDKIQNNCVRGARSRSSEIASSINQARRNRMRSYVVSELTENIDEKEASERQAIMKELGNQGELLVLNDLKSKGWEATRMPENNKGYDIEASNPETGEFLFVEVKGESFTWCDKGVGISNSQYEKAVQEQGSFVLAIVEGLRSAPVEITYIKDPISYITEYRFDDNWRDLSSIIQTIKAPDENVSNLERLSKLTDSDECRIIIEFCEVHEFPLPTVGLELVDDSGRVMGFELELAWEEEKVGVLTSRVDFDDAKIELSEWTIFIDHDKGSIKECLRKVFFSEAGCDD